MANNALLFNAALGGYLAGTQENQYPTSVTPGDYSALVTQATQFATEMDSLIANDNAGTPVPTGSVAISVITTGVAIAPTTGAIIASQIAKTGLLYGLCQGYAAGRYATGQLAAGHAVVCAAIRIIYLAAAANVVTA